MKNQMLGVARLGFKVALSKMPELRHWPDRGKPFRYEDSEVVRWLLVQPETGRLVFEMARNMGWLSYNSETGTWSGIDREAVAGEASQAESGGRSHE